MDINNWKQEMLYAFHRPDIIDYGDYKLIEFGFNDIDFPSSIEYHNNGKVALILYYLNGKIHRENGPAGIGYYESGKIKSLGYFIEGELYRENGPAWTKWDENGEIIFEKYYNSLKYTIFS